MEKLAEELGKSINHLVSNDIAGGLLRLPFCLRAITMFCFNILRSSFWLTPFAIAIPYYYDVSKIPNVLWISILSIYLVFVFGRTVADLIRYSMLDYIVLGIEGLKKQGFPRDNILLTLSKVIQDTFKDEPQAKPNSPQSDTQTNPS